MITSLTPLIPKIPYLEKYSFQIRSSPKEVWKAITAIGGENGWSYGTNLWKWRGMIDQLFGGIGYRKGRTDKYHLNKGDQIDFWRIWEVDPSAHKLTLKAEMKLPGEVYLTLELSEKELFQTVLYYPKNQIGKLYWHLVKPMHRLIFRNMGKNLAEGNFRLK